MKFVKEQVIKNKEDGYFTFVKDMTTSFGPLKEEMFDLLHSAKMIYLARSPVDTLLSFKKMVDKINDPRYNLQINYGYQDLWNIFVREPGHLVISEDFIERPSQVIEEVLNYLGLEYLE